MPRRFKQTVKDRMAESRGMERFETKKKRARGSKNSTIMGSNAAMHLISEDYSKRALLPTEVMQKPFGPSYGNTTGNIPADLFIGVERQMAQTGREFAREVKPSKF